MVDVTVYMFATTHVRGPLFLLSNFKEVNNNRERRYIIESDH